MIIDLRDNSHYSDDDLKTIAYFNGKRIVYDSLDNLYFEIIPRSSMSVNDMLNMDRLTPITKLPTSEQAAIREFVKPLFNK